MEESQQVKWGISQQFEFIEWRIFWVGRLNRSDLEERFGLSTPQASNDLRAYQDAAPDNIFYVPAERAYIPTSRFKPVFSRLSADRYLLQLDAILNGAVAPSVTWFGSLPPAVVMPDMVRSINQDILRAILAAIEQRHEIRITYQSLSKLSDRVIAPHAIAFDGHRWHARAWCEKNQEFRDFVLSRILKAEDRSQPCASNPANDVEWLTPVELKIIAHPDLSEPQRNAIALDYGFVNGSRIIKTRAALSFYLIRRLNLDLPNAIPPERQQIFLENLGAVEAVQLKAKADARKKTQREVTKLTA